MIRFGLPLPLTEQLRVGARRTWQSFASVMEQTTVEARNVCRWMTSPRLHLRRRAALRWAQRNLDELDAQYYRLVDIVCWAAKDGDHDGRDEKYAEVRGWFIVNYPHVEPILAPLATLAEDGRSLDAFRSLFAPESVDATIESSTAIERLFVTQSALQQLRVLVEKP